MYIFIQARSGSTRLPNKVMKDICGKPLLQHVIERCQQVTTNVVTLVPYDDPLRRWLSLGGYRYHEGPEDDVVERYYTAAIAYNAKSIMRITSDCPFADPALMVYSRSILEALPLDFVSNAPTAPDGLEVEICSFEALKYVHANATTPYDREHVTTFIKSNKAKFEEFGLSYAYIQSPILKEWCPKMSIDTEDDLESARSHMRKLNEQGVMNGL